VIQIHDREIKNTGKGLHAYPCPGVAQQPDMHQSGLGQNQRECCPCQREEHVPDPYDPPLNPFFLPRYTIRSQSQECNGDGIIPSGLMIGTKKLKLKI
jgi:hypothetical protein